VDAGLYLDRGSEKGWVLTKVILPFWLITLVVMVIRLQGEVRYFQDSGFFRSSPSPSSASSALSLIIRVPYTGMLGSASAMAR
jgi:hypothetical protein